ncbi:MAG: DNA-formamidopyrimidine glycosylase family protein [Actinomycetota bacterium]
MPEGDTLHRVAARLRPALEGEELTRFEALRATGTRPRPGETIDGVEAVGKHLLIHFSGGMLLRTHLRMTGSWHLYRTGERWQEQEHLARAVVGVEEWVAVCFAAPVVRLEPRGDAAVPGSLAHLGPDLAAEDPDLDEALERFGRCADEDTRVGPHLLDQRVACGVGNVYKSEVLWACRVSPFEPVSAIDVATRRDLLATAHRLLRANLGPGERQTVPGGLAVYGREGRPCRRCGTPIRRVRHGADPRSTWWCPRCQPASKASDPPTR